MRFVLLSVFFFPAFLPLSLVRLLLLFFFNLMCLLLSRLLFLLLPSTGTLALPTRLGLLLLWRWLAWTVRVGLLFLRQLPSGWLRGPLLALAGFKFGFCRRLGLLRSRRLRLAAAGLGRNREGLGGREITGLGSGRHWRRQGGGRVWVRQPLLVCQTVASSIETATKKN